MAKFTQLGVFILRKPSPNWKAPELGFNYLKGTITGEGPNDDKPLSWAPLKRKSAIAAAVIAKMEDKTLMRLSGHCALKRSWLPT